MERSKFNSLVVTTQGHMICPPPRPPPPRAFILSACLSTSTLHSTKPPYSHGVIHALYHRSISSCATFKICPPLHILLFSPSLCVPAFQNIMRAKAPAYAGQVKIIQQQREEEGNICRYFLLLNRHELYNFSTAFVNAIYVQQDQGSSTNVFNYASKFLKYADIFCKWWSILPPLMCFYGCGTLLSRVLHFLSKKREGSSASLSMHIKTHIINQYKRLDSQYLPHLVLTL